MHPDQLPLPPNVERLWLAALADARIDPDDALLYPLPGGQSDGYSAHSWLRSRTIYPNPRMPDLDPLLAQLNGDACVDACRVAIWTDRNDEGAAALLRHELEHDRQLDAHGERLLNLYQFSIEVLNERVAGLDGGSLVYQAIPMEFDANAAAAIFVRDLFGADRVDQLLRDGDEHGAAFRSLVPPPPVESLPERMVLFLASMPDLCTRIGDRLGIAVRSLLNREWPEAGDLWEEFVGTEGRLPREAHQTRRPRHG